MKLSELTAGQRARVLGFAPGRGLQEKMRQYGIFQGDEVRLVRCAPLRGPVLIEVGGREIALGRQVADKILVEVGG